MNTMPLTEVKAKLNELIDAAITTHERITITRHGKPAAVLLSVDDLESMEETLYWLAEPGVRDDIAKAREESAANELWDETAVRRRYGVGRA